MKTPDAVRILCEADSFLWLRFEEPQVKGVLTSALRLLSDAEFRYSVKKHSTLPDAEKDVRLAELTKELANLEAITLRFIKDRFLYNQLMHDSADRFFKENAEEIQKQFRRGTASLLFGDSSHGTSQAIVVRDENDEQRKS
jgi:hypothetical protein